jgi:hypothetical protein
MEKRTERMRHLIYIANLLFSFAGSLTIYANSTFIEKIVPVKFIGILYAISSIFSIIILSNASKRLSRFGNIKFFTFYGTIYTLSLLMLIVPVHPYIQVVAFIIYLCTVNVLIFSLNIFFEHLTKASGRGHTRGSFLLLGSIGCLLAPLVTAYVINLGGFSGMYMLGLGFFIILTILIQSGLSKYKDAEYSTVHLYSAVRHTLKEKTLRNVIATNFILQFFYAWMIVYTPIYLVSYLGFSWDDIGIIFAFMLTTFVMLDYPLGKIADYLGSEKELIAMGFLIMAASVFGLALISGPSLVVVGILLFFSRVGAATVEAMTEIHFYKIAKDSDPGLLALFSDIRPFAYIVAPLLGALAITLLPFKSIFIVLGVVLILGFVISFYLEKKQGWWIRAHKE